MKSVLEFLKKALKNKVVLGVIAIVLAIVVIKVAAHNKREADGVISVPPVEQSNLTDEELQQLKLNEMFGDPPAGFKWNTNGELIALGDNNLTPEDVGYAYIKALAQLEFATASKYSSSAVVPDNYNAMYKNQSTQGITQFTRSLYKEVLLSIEVNEVESTAIFDDGRYIITFNLSVLDLTNKEFWLKDSDTIYSNLYSFSTGEGDTSKANQYLYDYLLDYYSSDDALKREVSVDLVIDKSPNGGYLVSSDIDLDSLCRYQNGAVVSDFIWQCYTKWVNDSKR